MPNGSFSSYKRRRTRKKKGSRVERTKCCRTDFGASLSVSCSIAFLCRVSRRLALFRGTPECVRQHLRPAPFLCVSKRTGIGICSPPCSLFACIRTVPIVGCSVLIIHLFAYIYIHIFCSLRFPVSAYTRVICVEGPCPCVSLVLRSLCPCFLHPRLLFGSRPPRSRLISTRNRV